MPAVSQDKSIVNLCDNYDFVLIIDDLCTSLPNLVVHFSVCIYFHLMQNGDSVRSCADCISALLQLHKAGLLS